MTGKHRRRAARKGVETEVSDRPFRRSLTPSEFAEWCQISERSVRRLIAAGELKAIRLFPRVLRIMPADAERFFAGRAFLNEDATGSVADSGTR